MPAHPAVRRILTAELLSVGSELTVGETRDTNAGELARALTDCGVTVGRLTAVPDRLEVVRDAFAAALERADLVVSTGGFGPTPDDLTREAIAAVVGAEPVVDPGIEAWLRERWVRIGQPFPEINLKQAWLIPPAESLPNPNGSAPGWFVTRPDGRIVIALPGPPREMRPMWADHALPRLRAVGLGADTATRTFRLTGIGESRVAEVLGEELLRTPNPEVATYARVEAVDVRVSAVAVADGPHGGRSALELVDEAAAVVRERLGSHIWAEGDTTWGAAIGGRLRDLGWRIAIEEIATGGQIGVLIGDVDWAPLVVARRGPEASAAAATAADDADDGPDSLEDRARRIRDEAGVEVGLAVRARDRGDQLAVSVAVVTPATSRRETHATFVGGSLGRSRAALTTAAVLFEALRDG